jgi:hypothetical protein
MLYFPHARSRGVSEEEEDKTVKHARLWAAQREGRKAKGERIEEKSGLCPLSLLPYPCVPYPFSFIPSLIVTILIFVSPTIAQTSWWRTYGGWADDWGLSVQQTSDCGYIIAGSTDSFGAGDYDVYLIKTNTSGDALWTTTYGGTGPDFGYSVQQTSDGGYIIVGYTVSFGAGSEDVYLIKTNANGDTVWTKTYGGTYNDAGYSVRQTSDSGYIIAGGTGSFGAGCADVYLVKTNASGDTAWTRTYGGADPDMGFSVQQTSDGGYIIAGYTESFGAGNGDVYLIKTNASGDTLWTRTCGGTDPDRSYSVQQTSDSGYIIAGGAGSNGDVCLLKANASGDVLWTRTYGGANYDDGQSVRQTSDGGYVIAGTTESFGAGHDDAYLLKTKASGDTVWTRTYGGATYDNGKSVQQTSDGGYVIAGYTSSFGAGSYDVYLIKTDANGIVAVEEPSTPQLPNPQTALRVQPNPFSSFAVVPGHESERFILSDISGRKVAICNGNRIGEGLPPGVYFLSSIASVDAHSVRPVRIVKAAAGR